jgi:alkylation response protein AidB-like acyl-CoA dehydrogenase
MFTKVESARALSRAAIIYNRESLIPVLELSIASKVHCTRVAFEVAHDAVQLFGSYGLSKGYTIEKLFRDARSSLIADGCNEILALAAARTLIGNG